MLVPVPALLVWSGDSGLVWVACWPVLLLFCSVLNTALRLLSCPKGNKQVQVGLGRARRKGWILMGCSVSVLNNFDPFSLLFFPSSSSSSSFLFPVRTEFALLCSTGCPGCLPSFLLLLFSLQSLLWSSTLPPHRQMKDRKEGRLSYQMRIEALDHLCVSYKLFIQCYDGFGHHSRDNWRS